MKAKKRIKRDQLRPQYDFDYSTAVRGKYKDQTRVGEPPLRGGSGKRKAGNATR